MALRCVLCLSQGVYHPASLYDISRWEVFPRLGLQCTKKLASFPGLHLAVVAPPWLSIYRRTGLIVIIANAKFFEANTFFEDSIHLTTGTPFCTCGLLPEAQGSVTDTVIKSQFETRKRNNFITQLKLVLLYYAIRACACGHHWVFTDISVGMNSFIASA